MAERKVKRLQKEKEEEEASGNIKKMNSLSSSLLMFTL